MNPGCEVENDCPVAVEIPPPVIVARLVIPCLPALHVLDGLDAIARCLNWLIKEEFDPIKVVIDFNYSRPTITIKVCGRCEWLKKTYAAVKSGECWRINNFGCDIEWLERGN